jgi:hypothetical protein
MIALLVIGAVIIGIAIGVAIVFWLSGQIGPMF